MSSNRRSSKQDTNTNNNWWSSSTADDPAFGSSSTGGSFWDMSGTSNPTSTSTASLGNESSSSSSATATPLLSSPPPLPERRKSVPSNHPQSPDLLQIRPSNRTATNDGGYNNNYSTTNNDNSGLASLFPTTNTTNMNHPKPPVHPPNTNSSVPTSSAVLSPPQLPYDTQALHHTIEQQKNDIAKLTNELAIAKTDVEKRDAAIGRGRNALQKLQETVVDLRAQLTHAEKTITEANEKLRQNEEVLSKNKEEMNDLRNQLKNMVTPNLSPKNESQSSPVYEEEIVNLRKQIDETDKKYSQLQSEYSQLQTVMQQEKEKSLNDFNALRESARGKISQFRNELATVQATNTSLTAQLTALQEEKESLQQQIRTLSTTASSTVPPLPQSTESMASESTGDESGTHHHSSKRKGSISGGHGGGLLSRATNFFHPSSSSSSSSSHSTKPHPSSTDPSHATATSTVFTATNTTASTPSPVNVVTVQGQSVTNDMSSSVLPSRSSAAPSTRSRSSSQSMIVTGSLPGGLTAIGIPTSHMDAIHHSGIMTPKTVAIIEERLAAERLEMKLRLRESIQRAEEAEEKVQNLQQLYNTEKDKLELQHTRIEDLQTQRDTLHDRLTAVQKENEHLVHQLQRIAVTHQHTPRHTPTPLPLTTTTVPSLPTVTSPEKPIVRGEHDELPFDYAAGSMNSLEKLIAEEELEEQRWQEEQETLLQQQQKEQEIQYYKDQLRTLQMKLMDVEKSAGQRRQVSRKLLTDLQQVMRDYETSKDTVEKLRQEIVNSDENIKTKDKDIVDLSTRLQEVQTLAMQQAATAINQEETYTQKLSGLETVVHEKEKQIHELQRILAKDRNDHQEQVHTLRNEIETLKATSRQQYVLLEEELAMVRHERNEYRDKTEDVNQRLSVKEKELQQAKVLASRAESSGIAAEEQMKQYEVTLQSMKEQHAKNETKMNDLENAIRTMEQRATQAETAYTTLVHQQQETVGTNTSLQAQIKETEQTLSVLRQQLQQRTEQDEARTTEIERLQRLRTEAEEKVATLKTEMDRVNEALHLLQQESTVNQTEKAALQINYTELELKYQQLDEKCNQLKEKVAILETAVPTPNPVPDESIVSALEAQINVLMETNNTLETRILRLKESGQARIDQLKQNIAEEKEVSAALQTKLNEVQSQAQQSSEALGQELKTKLRTQETLIQTLEKTIHQHKEAEQVLHNEVDIQKKEVERIKGLANTKLLAAKEVKENAEKAANEAKHQAEQYKQELDHLRQQLTLHAGSTVNNETLIARLQAENRTLQDKLHHHETTPNVRIRELEAEIEEAKKAIITISDAAQEAANAAEAAARTAAAKSAEEAQDRVLLGQLRNELQLAQTKIQALEGEKQDLMKRLEDRVHGTEEGLKDTVAKYENDLSTMKKERDAAVAKYESRINELEGSSQVTTNKQKEQLRTLVQNNIETVQKLENQIRILEKERTDLSSQLLPIQQELTVTKQALQDKGASSSSTASALQTLQQQYSALQNQLRQTEEELRIAQATATETSMKLIAAQEEQARTASANDAVNTETLRALEARHQEESIALTNQLTTVHTELGKTQTKLHDLENQLTTKNEQYNALLASTIRKETVDTMNQLHHDWQEFETSTHEHLRILNERLVYLQEDCASLMTTIAEKDNEITRLQSTLQTKEEEFKAYTNKLVTQGLHHAHHHKDEKRTLEEHIQHLQSELEYYSNRTEELSETNQQYIDEYEIVEQRCNELVDRLQDAQDTNDNLTKEITVLKEQLQQVTASPSATILTEEQTQHIRTLETQIEQSHTLLNNAQATMDTVQVYIERIRGTAVTVQKDFGLLIDPPLPTNDKLQDIHQVLHAIYHRCTELEDTLGQRTETVTSLSVENDKLRQELGTVQTSYHNALESIHHVRDEMNRSVANRDKEITVLQQTIEAVTEEKHGAQRVMRLTLDKLRHANKVIEEHKLQEHQLIDQLEIRTKEFDEVTNNYAVLYEMYQDLASMNKHLDDKQEHHGEREKQMNEALREAHQALHEAHTIIQTNEEQMKQLMHDNQRLQEEFDKEREELIGQRDLAVSSLNQLRDDSVALQSYTEQTMTKVKEEKQVLQDLENELQRTKDNAQRTEDTLRTELDQLRTELATYHSSPSTVPGTDKGSSDDTDREHEQLLHDYGKLKDDHAALLNEFTEVMSQVGTAIKQVESLREEATAASAVSTMLEKKLATNQQFLTDTQSTLDRVRQERDTLRQTTKDLEEKIQDYESKRTSLTDVPVPSLSPSGRTLSKEDDDLLRQLLVESRFVSHESSIRASNLQEQCNTLLRQVDALITALDDHDPVNARNGLLSTLLGHQRDATMARNENKELKERLENAIEESVEAKLEMEQLKRTLSNAVPTATPQSPPSTPFANDENLHAALTAAREASALAMEDVASLSSKLSETSNRLDTAEQKLLTVETERTNALARVKELETELLHQKKQLTIQAQDFAQASKTAIESERVKHNQTLDEVNKGNENVINQLKGTINHLEQTIDKLEAHTHELIQKGKVSEARRIVLENLLEETNNELKDAQQHAIDTEKKLEALLKVSSAVDVATSPRKESNASDGSFETTASPSRLRTDPSIVDSTVLEAEMARATAADAARVTAEVALETMANDNDLLRRELAATSMQLAEVTASLAAADEVITDLRNKVTHHQETIDNLRKKYSALVGENQTLQDENKELSSTLQTNLHDIAELTSKLEDLENVSNEARAENDALRASVERITVQNKDLTESNQFLSDKLQQDHTELLNALTQLELHKEHEATNDQQLQTVLETMETLQGKLTNTVNEMQMLQAHRNASIQLAARLSNRISEFELLNKKVITLLQPILATISTASASAVSSTANEDTLRTVIALMHSLLSQTKDDEGGISPRTLIPHSVNTLTATPHRTTTNTYTSWVNVNSPGEPVMDAANLEPIVRMNAVERTLRLLHAQLEAYRTADIAAASQPRTNRTGEMEKDFAQSSLQLELSLVHPLLTDILASLGGQVESVIAPRTNENGDVILSPTSKANPFRSLNTLAYSATIDDNTRSTIDQYETEIQAWKEGTATKTPQEAAGKLAALAAALNELSQELDNKSNVTAQALADAEYARKANQNLSKEVETLRASHQALATQVPLLRQEFLRLESKAKDAENEADIAREAMTESRALAAKHEAGAAAAALRVRELEATLDEVAGTAKNAQADAIAAHAIIDQLQAELNRYKDTVGDNASGLNTNTVAPVPTGDTVNGSYNHPLASPSATALAQSAPVLTATPAARAIIGQLQAQLKDALVQRDAIRNEMQALVNAAVGAALFTSPSNGTLSGGATGNSTNDFGSPAVQKLFGSPTTSNGSKGAFSGNHSTSTMNTNPTTTAQVIVSGIGTAEPLLTMLPDGPSGKNTNGSDSRSSSNDNQWIKSTEPAVEETVRSLQSRVHQLEGALQEAIIREATAYKSSSSSSSSTVPNSTKPGTKLSRTVVPSSVNNRNSNNNEPTVTTRPRVMIPGNGNNGSTGNTTTAVPIPDARILLTKGLSGKVRRG